MATLSVNNPTLLDLARVTDPDGSIAQIVEILNMTNEVLDDMTWQEGNLLTGHRSSIRAGLPAPTWRKLYGGVQPNKARSVQVTDSCGMLEAYAEVDKKLADLNGNSAAFRLTEDRAHIEGINQELAAKIFYGNEVLAPETFTGLATRYATISGAENADNIVDHGGTGSDNTSIWIIAWSPDTVCGIVPPGLPMGLQHRDLGEIDAFDASNRRFRAYADDYKWNYGLRLKDWRAVVRICNIDVSDLVGTTANQQALTNYVIQGLNKIPSMYRSKARIYGNATALTAWDLGMRADVKAGGGLTYENVDGRPVMSFRGVPVRTSNAITVAETTIS